MNDDRVAFDDPSVDAGGFDPNDKTETFKTEIGKTYQVTVENEKAARRALHYGRRYEPHGNERPDELEVKDFLDGAVVLPNPANGEPLVLRPAASGKELHGYRRCLDYLKFCPACESEKAKLDKDDKRQVSPKKDRFGINIFLWKTDARGNLLGERTGEPIDCHGRFIILNKRGEWDQSTYKDTDSTDSPTGKVMFWSFNAKVFDRIRTQKNTHKKNGPLTHLNLLVGPDTVQTSQFKDHPVASLLHDMSAANFHRPVLDEAFKRKGIRNLEAFLVRDISPLEMVYFYGLEPTLLERARQLSGADAPAPDLEGKKDEKKKEAKAPALLPSQQAASRTVPASRPAGAPAPNGSGAKPAGSAAGGQSGALSGGGTSSAPSGGSGRAAVSKPTVVRPPSGGGGAEVPLDQVKDALDEL